MKKVIVFFAALFISVSSFAGNGPTLAKEIRNKAFIDLSSISLDVFNRDFVSVKFKIVDGEIEILKINGSQDVLEERVQEKLESMQIDSDYEEDKVYVLKFKFEVE